MNSRDLVRKLQIIKGKSLKESCFQRKSGPWSAGPVCPANTPWWDPNGKENEAAEEGGHAQQEEVQEGAEQAAVVHGLRFDGSTRI